MLKLTEPKKVLCIHDLSGVGRCSLAVILPVLSVMGVQPVALPTVVLSTHTGGFGTPARLDGCDYGMAALEHYRELGLEFDCIYTGYLGGEAQAAIAEKAFDLWPAAKKVVDPVMGDNGKAYSTVTPEFIDRMRTLCQRADLILPNVTEAGLLLRKETFPENFDYPYLARSVTDFWRRWHQTLGQWFRDYVYIPLGGSRTTRAKWIRNVAVVWLLTGLWHGAAWNFVLWGGYFGLLLLTERLWLGKRLTRAPARDARLRSVPRREPAGLWADAPGHVRRCAAVGRGRAVCPAQLCRRARPRSRRRDAAAEAPVEAAGAAPRLSRARTGADGPAAPCRNGRARGRLVQSLPLFPLLR